MNLRAIKSMFVVLFVLPMFAIGAESFPQAEAVKRLIADMKPIPGRPFLMERTEVTVSLWNAVMNRKVSSPLDNEMPVSGVSWDDCQDFIKQLNETKEVRNAGLKFRLPTVREWTYVCRAGGRGDWGNLSTKTAGTLDAMGWYAGNCGGKKSPVARKEPNAWGFFDMHGNVFEWCSDVSPMYGGDFRERVGGGFRSPKEHCAAGFVNSANRQFSRYDDQGFRLLAEPCTH